MLQTEFDEGDWNFNPLFPSPPFASPSVPPVPQIHSFIQSFNHDSINSSLQKLTSMLHNFGDQLSSYHLGHHLFRNVSLNKNSFFLPFHW